jgi:hypothetical protein
MVFSAPGERENSARRKEPEGRRGAGFESPNDRAPEAGRENPCWNTVGHSDSRAPAGAHHPVAETGGRYTAPCLTPGPSGRKAFLYGERDYLPQRTALCMHPRTTEPARVVLVKPGIEIEAVRLLERRMRLTDPGDASKKDPSSPAQLKTIASPGQS